jgi:alpha-tubulin suppressor-like RCC1 family protein
MSTNLSKSYMCSDGLVAGWGSNYYGELGIGQRTYPIPLPYYFVYTTAQFTTISSGLYHNLAQVCFNF